MICPEKIRSKASRLYPQYLQAWVNGEEFFPRVLPAEKHLDEDLVSARESVLKLRNGSKEVLGYGYTIEWVERRSKQFGANRFPSRISFETPEDFLKFLRKGKEFQRFEKNIQLIRSRLPELETWILSHIKRVASIETRDILGMIEIAEYLKDHPRPEIFIREIPVSMDTKFIERNEGIIREWLDRVLPSDSIIADEKHFERRYGFRFVNYLGIRFLDSRLQTTVGSPWNACALAPEVLRDFSIPCRRVLIVENKVNLYTLPEIPETIALEGSGNHVTDFWRIQWLEQRELWYWGDLDFEGLMILSRLRSLFPQVKSILMDDQTLNEHRESIGVRVDRSSKSKEFPTNLIPSELAALQCCASEGVRIEQERIPQPVVIRAIQDVILSQTSIS